jgi:hypothetical protein
MTSAHLYHYHLDTAEGDVTYGVIIIARGVYHPLCLCRVPSNLGSFGARGRRRGFGRERRFRDFVDITPYGRTLESQLMPQGPARGAVAAYVPRLITSPSS